MRASLKHTHDLPECLSWMTTTFRWMDSHVLQKIRYVNTCTLCSINDNFFLFIKKNSLFSKAQLSLCMNIAGVVYKIMTIQGCQWSEPCNIKYVTLNVKKDSADVIKFWCCCGQVITNYPSDNVVPDVLWRGAVFRVGVMLETDIRGSEGELKLHHCWLWGRREGPQSKECNKERKQRDRNLVWQLGH